MDAPFGGWGALFDYETSSYFFMCVPVICAWRIGTGP